MRSSELSNRGLVNRYIHDKIAAHLGSFGGGKNVHLLDINELVHIESDLGWES